jgi:spermidine/putrescine transport system substrate-binding protein
MTLNRANWIASLALALGLVGSVPLARAESAVLNLFIWSEYIDPKIVKDFEKQFRCKVNIDLYEDSESMMAKIQGGGAALYDVIVPSDNLVPALIKQGLLAPLRTERLPNLKHLDPKFARPAYDPENKFTVAYQWGTVGLLARKVDGKPVPDSWTAVFDAAQPAGSFLLMDSMRDTIGVALKYKGYSANSTNANELREAREVLIAAKKRSVGFDGSVGVKNKVLGKTAQLGMVYSGEGVRAMTENEKFVYFVPKEGSIAWVDNLAVLARAPHRDLAEQFINFILEPKVGARLSTFTQFATPNAAARQFMDKEDLEDPAAYPPPETMARLEFLHDLGARLRLYDEVWTQVKAR